MSATAPREGLLQRRRKKLPATLFKTWSPEKSDKIEDCDVLKKYRIIERIGHGSSGQVYQAQSIEDGTHVALKFMNAVDQDMTFVRRAEYNILKDISHPHIVKALDFFCAARTAVLVLSYHAGATLHKATRESRDSCLSEKEAKPLSRMLFSAIDYLHQRRIVHRDVKADNILVSKDLQDLHLADFNTARSLLEGGALTMTGTLEYSAPEVLAGESPSEFNDIWGGGLCVHFMLTGSLPRRPVKYSSLAAFQAAVQSKPVDCRGSEWQHVSEDGKETVRRCLAVQKEHRPAAMTVLKMPWFASNALDAHGKHGGACDDDCLGEPLQSMAFERAQTEPADLCGHPESALSAPLSPR